jgi:hypothetical protein
MQDTLIANEFALVAACCRWPLTPDGLAEVCRRSGRAIDWNYVLRIAERHRVVGLVHHALHAASVSVPREVWTPLTAGSQTIARQNLTLAVETVRLQRRFESAGISLLTLKGLSLAQQAYGTLALKHGRDIDLLVAPDHAFAALRLLEQDGYSLLAPATELRDRQRHAFIARGHELEVVNSSGTRIELHWRLTENPHLTHRINGFAAPQAVPLPGGIVYTLGDDDLFAYLCVHGASHFWFRLKWLADLNALLSQSDEREIERFYHYAQVHGAGRCAAQALLLAETIFGRPLAPTFSSQLRRDRYVRRLVRIAIEKMIGSDAAAEPVRRASEHAKDSVCRFLLGGGMRFFIAQIGIVSVAPKDVLAWQLPRPVWILYPLIRLPSWIIRRLTGRGGTASGRAKQKLPRKGPALR